MAHPTIAVATAAPVSATNGMALQALLHRMVESCPEDCRQFVARTLQPLADYDAATGSDLIHTLVTYLDCDASMERTASALMLHRHTVRYRLGRIAELTSQNPYTTCGREELGLAIKLRALLSS